MLRIIVLGVSLSTRELDRSNYSERFISNWSFFTVLTLYPSSFFLPTFSAANSYFKVISVGKFLQRFFNFTFIFFVVFHSLWSCEHYGNNWCIWYCKFIWFTVEEEWWTFRWMLRSLRESPVFSHFCKNISDRLMHCVESWHVIWCTCALHS